MFHATNRLKTMLLRTTLLLVVGILPAAAVTFPQPRPLQLPPVASSPGGSLLPDFQDNAAAGAPAFAAITEIARPGDTLAASGASLKDASTWIWAEGMFREVEPTLALDNRLATLVPADYPESVYLVWPDYEGTVGAPIRVNAPAAWWVWQSQEKPGTKGGVLRIMGKNLHLPGSQAVVFIKGSNYADFVEVQSASAYRLEANLPNLEAGNYKLWVHNGTGGQFGWSEPLSIEVGKGGFDYSRTERSIEAYGARIDGEIGAPLAEAIEDLAQVGGGTIRLPAGRFYVDQPIDIKTAGIRIVGAGQGNYKEGEETVSGSGTLLTYRGAGSALDSVIEISAPNVSVEGLTVVNGNDGRERSAIKVLAPDVSLRNVRVVFLDRRDWGYSEPGPFGKTGEERRLKDHDMGFMDDGAVILDTRGPARFHFSDSEIHAAGPGLQVGLFSGWDTMVSQAPAQSIWVEKVKFRGYYAGEPDGLENSGSSGRATGVVIYSGRQIAVEQCSFQSADRWNRKIMGRTVLVFNTSSRDMYFGENESLNVGPHPSAVGMNENQGEQYLIHYRYPYGGLFEVETAGTETLTVSTANIEPFPAKRDPSTRWDLRSPHFHFNTMGSRVLPEVGHGGNWILFVSAGTGVGQFREISAAEQAGESHTFSLNKPWTIVPDASSRVNLMPAYRHIVIYKNHVDTGELLETHKTHGVTFWFDSFENVVEGNTFRNLTSGIIFNSRFRGPTGWNTTRDNVVENIAGYPGDTSEKAAGYVDHTRVVVQWPKPEDRVWYQVGNVARNNVIRNAEVGVYLHTRYTGLVRYSKPPVEAHPDGGIVLSVVEGNRIEDVREGIVLSSPVNAAVIRDNSIDAAGMTLPPIYSQDSTQAVIDSVLNENLFNGQPITNLPEVEHDGVDRPRKRQSSSASSQEEANEVESLPSPEGAFRLFLREGALELPGGLADPAYRAPSATLRSHLPGEVSKSTAMYIGTHEAGGETQANRGLFSFPLAPLQAYLAREGGRIERVYLVLTTASANEMFPGDSIFHLHSSSAFDKTIATWSNPGRGAAPGGAMKERLTSMKLTPAHAAQPGSHFFFGGEPLKEALSQELQNSNNAALNLLVKRANENDTRQAHYYFRPADSSHRHSAGHLDWRPALVVDVSHEN